MCQTCNQLKLNDDIDGIVARMDALEAILVHEEVDPVFISTDGVVEQMFNCIKELDLYLGSISLVDQYEEARLALSRGLGQPEPILYENDPSPFCTNQIEEDILAQVIELQLRMEKGMGMIQECQEVLDRAHSGEQRLSYENYMKWFNRRKKFWDHWWTLKAECDALIKEDKAYWAVFFNIEDKDQFLIDYKEKDYNPTNDSTAIDELEMLRIEGYEQCEVYKDTHILQESINNS